MAFEISRREVLNNLIRFKEYLLEASSERGTQEKKIPILLNLRTGDIRFAKKIRALEGHISRAQGKQEAPADWKEAQLAIVKSSKGFTFELLSGEGRPLKPAELTDLAWLIASETVGFLNFRAQEIGEPKGGGPIEEIALQDLPSIRLSIQQGRIEELPGWSGPISRLEAEERLQGSSIGTYLLRSGDEITLSMAHFISEENLLTVRAYLMTVVEEEKKISDILLIQTNKGWTLYHDDPDLQDSAIYRFFPSAQGLIHSLPIARYPRN